MAGSDDSGDKTEKPTQRRLDEARRKGDVAKSKDLPATIGLLVWLLLFSLATGLAGQRLAAMFAGIFDSLAAGRDVSAQVAVIGWAAASDFVLLTSGALLPVLLVGVAAEVLQTGPVLSFDKLKPDLGKLNPVEGIKRMFSLDNLVELAKTIAKTALLLFVAWVVIRAALPQVLGLLPLSALPTAAGAGRDMAMASLVQTGQLTTSLLGWTLACFVLVAALDVAWTRHSHEKKLRMSLRDIRDEVKQDEGDPQLKGQRRQLHQEWASQNNVAAARGAHVLVVNPTHIAIALDYDAQACPVPVVAGRGDGALAQAMREAAEMEGVPIIRNIDVARALFDRTPVGEVVPEDMFDAIATIIVWARQQRGARPDPEDSAP